MTEKEKTLGIMEISDSGDSKPLNKNNLLQLKIIPENGGYTIFLDDKKIHHIEKYRIEYSGIPGAAILKLELLVKFP